MYAAVLVCVSLVVVGVYVTQPVLIVASTVGVGCLLVMMADHAIAVCELGRASCRIASLEDGGDRMHDEAIHDDDDDDDIVSDTTSSTCASSVHIDIDVEERSLITFWHRGWPPPPPPSPVLGTTLSGDTYMSA